MVVGFTHNDLDALGVILCIQYKMPVEKWFCTCYYDIDTQVDACVNYCKANNIHKIIIGDVSFSDRKYLLKKLYNYIVQFDDGYILHCDHHSYPEPEMFWDEFPKMKLVYTDKECATMQLLKLFKIDESNETNLVKICSIIDAYDCWRKKSKLFSAAQKLNDYFWNYVRTLSNGSLGDQYNRMVELAKILKNLNYKLPSDFMQVAEACEIKAQNDYNNLKARNLLKRYNSNIKTTIILSNDSFNKIQLMEMADGQDFVVGITNGVFMCRVNDEHDFSLTFLRELRYQLCGMPDYCHPCAFTYEYKGAANVNNIMNEIKRIITVINSIPRDIKVGTFEDIPF